VTRLLARSSARFYLRHPAQALLAIAGISLGVTVFIGVTLAIDSATRAFDQSAQFVRGRATHRVLPVGRDLTDATYVELVRAHGIRAAPILEASVRIEGPPRVRATLFGVDPIKEGAFRDFTRFAPGNDAGDVTRVITEVASALVSERLLEGLGDPSHLELVTDTGSHTVNVVGSLAGDASDLIVTDLSSAQELTGQIGILSRIDLIMSDAQARALEATLPPATALVPASNENAQFAELSRAFRINVSALGLIALVVGAFLIYSTMAFAIVQRRKPFAILRALGTSQRDLSQVVATEALVMGIVGAVLGMFLGTVLAAQLVGGVAATIDDFAFRLAVAVAKPSPWLYVQGAGLGVIASLIAAIGPLRDVARTDPSTAMQRVVLERTSARRVMRAPLAAGALLLLAAGLLLAPTRSLYVAFASLACVLAAGAMLAPAAIMTVTRVLEPVAARIGGLYGRMAARNVRAHQSRIAVAAAALTLAVATVIGVGLMIGSFRVSLARWLDTTLTSDVFLSAEQPFDPGRLLDRLTRLPQVSGISEARLIELPSEFGNVRLRAFAPAHRGFGLHIVDGDERSVIAALSAGTDIAIAEPFAYRHKLGHGDALDLPTPQGIVSFRIAGIFRDYNTGGASILMPLAKYRRLWNDLRVNTLGLELDAPLTTTVLRETIGAQPGDASIRVRRTDMIKDISLQIFDRTFAITTVLRTLAGIVAFLGMLSALLAIALERRRETAILRALGFPPRGMSALTMTETALTGIAAGIIATPLGLVLAALLVYVINRRSFGWTMELAVELPPIAIGIGLAVSASLLAGLLPSFQQSQQIKGSVLQYE
jgi:putative ABC transport system permease protein